jgi:hypothetical protein
MAHIRQRQLLEQLEASRMHLRYTNQALEYVQREVARVRDYNHKHGLALHFSDISSRHRRAFKDTLLYKRAAPHITNFYNEAIADTDHQLSPAVAQVFAVSDHSELTGSPALPPEESHQ